MQFLEYMILRVSPSWFGVCLYASIGFLWTNCNVLSNHLALVSDNRKDTSSVFPINLEHFVRNRSWEIAPLLESVRCQFSGVDVHGLPSSSSSYISCFSITSSSSNHQTYCCLETYCFKGRSDIQLWFMYFSRRSCCFRSWHLNFLSVEVFFKDSCFSSSSLIKTCESILISSITQKRYSFSGGELDSVFLSLSVWSHSHDSHSAGIRPKNDHIAASVIEP
jgi:hypothetical protein